jgi:hypothetical protein
MRTDNFKIAHAPKIKNRNGFLGKRITEFQYTRSPDQCQRDCALQRLSLSQRISSQLQRVSRSLALSTTPAEIIEDIRPTKRRLSQ